MQTTRSSRSGGLGRLFAGRMGDLLLNGLIVLLVLLVLFLPPISLGERIVNRGHTPIGTEGGSILEADGTQATFPTEAMTDDAQVRLTSVPRLNFLEGTADKGLVQAAESLPNHLLPRSPFYMLSVRGGSPEGVTLSVPIPNDSEPYETLDIYTWDGNAWQWLPSQMIYEDEMIESRLGFVPANFMVMQTLAREPVVAAPVVEGKTIPQAANTGLTEVYVPGLILGSDGTLMGSLPAISEETPGASYTVIPWIRDWGDDGVVRTDLVSNLLISGEARNRHNAALTGLAVSHLYPGILLDYRGIDPELRADFSRFVVSLADALHAEGKRLIVRVEAPYQVAEDKWITGGYDWRALGSAADVLEVQAPTDPRAYADGGQMTRLLRWAVGQVNRYDLRFVFPARSVEQVGDYLLLKSYADSLAPLVNRVQVVSGVIAPGESVTLQVLSEHETTALQPDPAAGGTLRYQYMDDSGTVHTVWLENAASLTHKLSLVNQFHIGGVALESLLDAEQGNDPNLWSVVSQFQQATALPLSGSDLALVWQVGDQPAEAIPLGDRTIHWQAPQTPGEYVAQIALMDLGQVVGTPQVISLLVASPTPMPSPTPTFTPTSLPSPTPRPTATSAPRVAAAAAGFFGYGVQAHMVHNDHAPKVMQMTQGMGFGWVKQQVEWKIHEPNKGQYEWGPLDNIADTAAANGIQVMFSVVKAPAWARPGGTDLGVEGPPQHAGDYADFVRAMAQRYCGRVQSYEIWNEQNLHYEWGNEALDAGRYVQLLAAAYNAIKSVCPQAIVISGALTPTGVNDGRTAIDDFVYLEQMYQAGLKNYSDGIGAHPSGYNVAPDVYGDQACDPGFIFQGPCNTPHHSWSFRSTMEGYRNIMVKYGDSGKRIWPTEFGWASSPTPTQHYEYAADNTLDEQAQYTVRAYQMMKGWGWVGVAFLWNLNFKVVAAGSEMAQWGIVDQNWGPMPVYNSLAGMAK